MQSVTGQPNGGPTTDLPHPLLRAFERLESALDEGIDQFKRNRNFSNAADVCSATERFVDEFCRVPAWEAELRRRAVFVEERCTQGSVFRRAMDTALSQYRSQPKKAVGSGISGPRLAIQELRRIGAGLCLADEIVRVRQTLERAIAEGIFGIQVQPVIQQWLKECRDIQHEAERTQADGCYFLFHMHLVVQANPSDRSVCVKAIIDSGTIGGGQLEFLSTAAESLVSWARDNLVLAASVKQPGDATTDLVVRVMGGESKDEAVKKRSWTQSKLDGAIHEYLAKRASTYNDLVEGVRRDQPGAKKAARKLFGRNVIVRALGVKSGAMVTNSPAWQEIADELGLRERAGMSRRAQAQRIGMEIALEEQSVATGESAVDQVVRRETIALAEKSMPKAEAEATIEKLQRGEITDDQARELIEVSADQKQDNRTRTIRQGL